MSPIKAPRPPKNPQKTRATATPPTPEQTPGAAGSPEQARPKKPAASSAALKAGRPKGPTKGASKGAAKTSEAAPRPPAKVPRARREPEAGDPPQTPSLPLSQAPEPQAEAARPAPIGLPKSVSARRATREIRPEADPAAPPRRAFGSGADDEALPRPRGLGRRPTAPSTEPGITPDLDGVARPLGRGLPGGSVSLNRSAAPQVSARSTPSASRRSGSPKLDITGQLKTTRRGAAPAEGHEEVDPTPVDLTVSEGPSVAGVLDPQKSDTPPAAAGTAPSPEASTEANAAPAKPAFELVVFPARRDGIRNFKHYQKMAQRPAYATAEQLRESWKELELPQRFEHCSPDEAVVLIRALASAQPRPSTLISPGLQRRLDALAFGARRTVWIYVLRSGEVKSAHFLDLNDTPDRSRLKEVKTALKDARPGDQVIVWTWHQSTQGSRAQPWPELLGIRLANPLEASMGLGL